MTSDKSDNDVEVQLTGQSVSVEQGRLAASKRVQTGRRRGKAVTDLIEGQEYSVDGILVDKVRVIDRDQNLYREVVQNADTGEVLRKVEHPLSDHRDRGDAKPGRRK
jgi:hypothetical protein